MQNTAANQHKKQLMPPPPPPPPPPVLWCETDRGRCVCAASAQNVNRLSHFDALDSFTSLSMRSTTRWIVFNAFGHQTFQSDFKCAACDTAATHVYSGGAVDLTLISQFHYRWVINKHAHYPCLCIIKYINKKWASRFLSQWWELLLCIHTYVHCASVLKLS